MIGPLGCYQKIVWHIVAMEIHFSEPFPSSIVGFWKKLQCSSQTQRIVWGLQCRQRSLGHELCMLSVHIPVSPSVQGLLERLLLHT